MELQLAWDVQARMTFFSSYIAGLSRTHDMLAPVYEDSITIGHGSTSSHYLSDSVDAVSLAFMAHHQPQHQNQPALWALARKRYQGAIQQVRAALLDKERAVRDDTLQSVLMLDLYEKIANRGPPKPDVWMVHVNGALALIKARGATRNLDSQTARRLASRVITTLTVSASVMGIRIPEAVVELYRDLSVYFPRTDVKWRVIGLIHEQQAFHADVTEGKYASNEEALKGALRIDARFAAVREELEPLWRPTQVPLHTAPNPLVPRGDSHFNLYKDHITTQGANVFRTMRLFLHTVIQQLLNDVAGERGVTTNNNNDGNEDSGNGGGASSGLDRNVILAASHAIINETIYEICAAVPQFILPGARPINNVPFAPLQTMQCYAMLPPMFAAAQLSNDVEVRGWAVRALRYMADGSGMEMASRFADIIETSQETPFWNVYAMMGSYAFGI